MMENYLNKEELLTKREIQNWLQTYRVHRYTINDDLTVDVDGDVKLTGKDLDRIPFQFGKVSKSFMINSNNLTSLKGVPYEVGNYFNCSYNQLTSLEHCPINVGGNFNCHANQLRDLNFVPESIGKGDNFWVIDKNTDINDPYQQNQLQDFKDKTYYEVDPKDLLQYLKSEKLSNKLQEKIIAIRSASEVPFKNTIRNKI